MAKRRRKEPMRIISSRTSLPPRDGGAPELDVNLVRDDPILPYKIHHQAEQLFEAQKLQESYNWIDYHFERDGAYCRARTYLLTIGEVAIFGPFAGPDNLQPVDAPELREAVVAYLKRRFNTITELKEQGYETIWRRQH